MGEESTSPVYIGRYEDGKVVFEPLVEFEVVDHDITDVYPDDMVKPMQCVRTIMRDKTITIKAFLRKKGLRGFYKAIGMPAYLRTEYLFPKKKRRGTTRRKRKLRRYEQNFRAYIKEHYGSHMIGTRATQVIIDDFFIPEPSPISPLPEPFEGEEEEE